MDSITLVPTSNDKEVNLGMRYSFMSGIFTVNANVLFFILWRKKLICNLLPIVFPGKGGL